MTTQSFEETINNTISQIIGEDVELNIKVEDPSSDARIELEKELNNLKRIQRNRAKALLPAIIAAFDELALSIIGHNKYDPRDNRWFGEAKEVLLKEQRERLRQAIGKTRKEGRS